MQAPRRARGQQYQSLRNMPQASATEVQHLAPRDGLEAIQANTLQEGALHLGRLGARDDHDLGPGLGRQRIRVLQQRHASHQLHALWRQVQHCRQAPASLGDLGHIGEVGRRQLSAQQPKPRRLQSWPVHCSISFRRRHHGCRRSLCRRRCHRGHRHSRRSCRRCSRRRWQCARGVGWRCVRWNRYMQRCSGPDGGHRRR
mmetsp:Transcript_85630/g.240979  ORF Transcript_85630/g.240979 Transcript_85630/m.240979 type:complete len:200 (-) Transcript_85630:51-650(-)